MNGGSVRLTLDRQKGRSCVRLSDAVRYLAREAAHVLRSRGVDKERAVAFDGGAGIEPGELRDLSPIVEPAVCHVRWQSFGQANEFGLIALQLGEVARWTSDHGRAGDDDPGRGRHDALSIPGRAHVVPHVRLPHVGDAELVRQHLNADGLLQQCLLLQARTAERERAGKVIIIMMN